MRKVNTEGSAEGSADDSVIASGDLQSSSDEREAIKVQGSFEHAQFCHGHVYVLLCPLKRWLSAVAGLKSKRLK